MTETKVKFSIQSLRLSRLRESKQNVRKHFNAEAMRELVHSVKQKGVLTPLLVRPKNGSFEILAGARRYRAAKTASLKAVPVIVRETTDDEALEIILIDNLQRDDVHELEESLGYEALLKTPGYVGNGGADRIAKKIGKSRAYVYQRLKLLDLVPELRKAFFGEQITAGHAVQIARLGPDDQKAALRTCTQRRETWVGSHQHNDSSRIEVKGGLSVRDLREWISRVIMLDLHGAPWKKDDKQLVPKAGPCTTCPKRSGFSPELFPDVKKDSICADRTCYGLKFRAWIAARGKEAKGKNLQFVAVSDCSSKYDFQRFGMQDLVLSQYDWKKAKKLCKPQVVGLLVDGKNVGNTVMVCGGKDCKNHSVSYSSPSDTSWRKEQNRKQKQAAALTILRSRIFDAALPRVKKLQPADLQMIARDRYDNTYGPDRTRVNALFGLKSNSAINIAKLKPQQLARLVVGCQLAPDVHVNAYSLRRDFKDLRSVAKRQGVKVGAIERQFKKEQKAAAAKKRAEQAAARRRKAKRARKAKAKKKTKASRRKQGSV